MSTRTEKSEGQPPLVELQALLDQGCAKAQLDQTRLARRAGLGRTTVSQALRGSGQVPSAATVAALAKALGLDADRLLRLRQRAVAEAGGAGGSAPGREADGVGQAIGEWDPYDLEVHPAGAVDGRSGPAGSSLFQTLPGYVRRSHDDVLAEVVQAAAQGRSGMLVLVGSSSTGKTRACWEAIQPLAAQGWRLWHPFDPTRAEAALTNIRRVGPRTVVWLNEAQHYLGDTEYGTDIAAAVRSLLTDPEIRPVLVLGTLWPEYDRAYRTLPLCGELDRYAQVRALLAGRTVPVPDAFDENAQEAARELAATGDQMLAAALERAEAERVTQDLAGAPELLHRYRTASAPARAVLQASMDARRLGVGLHIPLAFLTDAGTDYLSDREYDELPPDWAEKALAELAEPVHGRLAPLRRARPRPARRDPGAPLGKDTGHGVVYRLADYLEHHGGAERRRLCPPASFWQAAHHHLTGSQDLGRLAHAAERRHRLQWAYHLYQRADPGYALMQLVRFRKRAGHAEDAVKLLSNAAADGNRDAFFELVGLRLGYNDLHGAEQLLTEPADRGDTRALIELAELRLRTDDQEGAERLLTSAAGAGATSALVRLSDLRREAGDSEGAKRLLTQAADAGDDLAIELIRMQRMHEVRGKVDRRRTADASETASALAVRQDSASTDGHLTESADAGHFWAIAELARADSQPETPKAPRNSSPKAPPPASPGPSWDSPASDSRAETSKAPRNCSHREP
ncbi:tetratricopeptide repeat protein [Streptomyces sp. NBC_00353]|uniref:tetratricopeptide repeat protein n=1 Tax=unclassified Streptomyces TaxID=2593676 RepID=UPI002E27567E